MVEESPKIVLEKSAKNVPNPERQENIENTDTRNPKVQTEKVIPPFNLGAEVAKLTISVPLTELVKNHSYRSHITRTLNI